MQAKDYQALFLLAAIWGASFLFMRLSINDFGPWALTEVRVGFSAIFLLLVAFVRGRIGALRRNALHIGVTGVFAAGLPFFCFNFAAQTVPASFMAVINAITPLFGALIARAWLRERLSRTRIIGLAIGFIGIVVLVWNDLSFGENSMGIGVFACLTASFSYSIGACYTTRHLQNVDPIAIAAGSVTAAALVLLPLAILTWPATPISTTSWAAASGLSLLCTGVAYILYYGLINRVGATRSMTVTFLVPLFGILWGTLILDEQISLRMLTGTAIVLLGTLLATGFIGGRKEKTTQ